MLIITIKRRSCKKKSRTFLFNYPQPKNKQESWNNLGSELPVKFQSIAGTGNLAVVYKEAL
jgi:hypothetical protein